MRHDSRIQNSIVILKEASYAVVNVQGLDAGIQSCVLKAFKHKARLDTRNVYACLPIQATHNKAPLQDKATHEGVVPGYSM